MICPNCKEKMKCQDSRQVDNTSRIREYGCPKCEKVFQSIEQLDDKPVDKLMQNASIEYLKERKRCQTST